MDRDMRNGKVKNCIQLVVKTAQIPILFLFFWALVLSLFRLGFGSAMIRVIYSLYWYGRIKLCRTAL